MKPFSAILVVFSLLLVSRQAFIVSIKVQSPGLCSFGLCRSFVFIVRCSRMFFFFFYVSYWQLVSCNHARKDPAGDYWRTMTKDQPIPEAIRDLMIRTGTADHGRFVKDFDIRHNFIIYHAHGGHKDGKSSDAKGHLKSAVLGNQAWRSPT